MFLIHVVLLSRNLSAKYDFQWEQTRDMLTNCLCIWQMKRPSTYMIDQRCIFIGCFSLCYPGYSARLALTNGFPPQKGFNHGGISVKLHGFANHYRYAMQTSLFFFYSYNSNVHRGPSALLKICLFHYDTSNWQFYENAGLVFFAKNIEKSL